MIIQCEQCQTKFRLDDSKVTDKGVKVRCAKCKHIFSVKSAQPETTTPSDFGTLLDQSVSLRTEEETTAPSTPPMESCAPETTPGTEIDYSDFIAEDFSLQGKHTSVETFEPSGDASMTMGEFKPSNDEHISSFTPAGDEFSLSSLDGELGFALEHEENKSSTGEVDFGGFDFGSDAVDADKTVVAAAPVHSFTNTDMTPPADTLPAAETNDTSPFDFVDEPVFADVLTTPTTGIQEESTNFDAQMQSIDVSAGVNFNSLEPVLTAVDESKGDAPFSMGEIDFGAGPKDTAAKQTQSEEPEPPKENLSATLAEVKEESAHHADQDTIRKVPDVEAPPTSQEEQPPLSIASRRRHNPMFSVLIAVATVIAVAVLGFFGYTMFLEDKGKGIVEAGRITVRSVDASFVKNPAIGDLLVITGEAVNTYTKPRAAIQIKGMVYGPNGQILSSKNTYCGNPLTKVQLAGMSLDKIEAAMANQFGDSLTNLEVPPGKSIPFVIVIAKPPADAKEYGVEPVGSTVATGKQQ